VGRNKAREDGWLYARYGSFVDTERYRFWCISWFKFAEFCYLWGVGVTFPSTRELSDPFAHFGTEQPPDGTTGYRDLAQGCHTEVWLGSDNNFVVLSFMSMSTCSTNDYVKRTL
jgi:hypothetical protein